MQKQLPLLLRLRNSLQNRDSTVSLSERLCRSFSSTSSKLAGEAGVVSGAPEDIYKRKVIIFSPARTPSQQGLSKTVDLAGKGAAWKIEFSTEPKWENPLIGWTSTADPVEHVARSAVSFASADDAAAFCMKHGWAYEIRQPQIRRTTRQKRFLGYGDNFSTKRGGIPDGGLISEGTAAPIKSGHKTMKNKQKLHSCFGQNVKALTNWQAAVQSTATIKRSRSRLAPAVNMDDADLPKALIKRIAKAKLSKLEATAGRTDNREVQISKDALLALSESAKVFINYLTATGNDICKDSKRQIISMDDVLTALEDLEFAEILPALKESLEVFKVENKEKSKKRAEQQKRRKLEDAEAAAAVAATASGAQDTAQPVTTNAGLPGTDASGAVAALTSQSPTPVAHDMFIPGAGASLPAGPLNTAQEQTAVPMAVGPA